MKRVEKKKLVREAIYNVSMIEFFNNGYKEASMRTIAKKVDMTVGNLYCYYENKADIFDSLVKDVYDQMKVYLDLAAQLVIRSENIRDSSIKDIIRQGAELIDTKRNHIFILINKSAGTKYENVKSEFVQQVCNNHRGIIEAYEKKFGKPFEGDKEFVAYLSGVFFIEGLIEITLKFENRKFAEEKIIELVRLLFEGIYGFYKRGE